MQFDLFQEVIQTQKEYFKAEVVNYLDCAYKELANGFFFNNPPCRILSCKSPAVNCLN